MQIKKANKLLMLGRNQVERKTFSPEAQTLCSLRTPSAQTAIYPHESKTATPFVGSRKRRAEMFALQRNSIRLLLSFVFVMFLTIGAAAQTPTAQPTPPPQPQPLPTPQQQPQPNASPAPGNPNNPGTVTQPGNTSVPPGTPAPQPQNPPPGSNNNQQQQPQPGQTQTQPNAPAGVAPGTVSPQNPGNLTTPGNVNTTPGNVNATPGNIAMPSGAGQPAPTAAGQGVGESSGIAPAELPTEPPPIEPNFEAPARPLPSAERVGVDVTDQTVLSLNEAIALALENNHNIETARINVRISEFDLRAARGAFDPRVAGESFFERNVVPTASTLGGANGSTTSTGFTGNLGANGFVPFGGGSYQSSFSSSRQTTNNPFIALNPQFPTALNLSFTQPLLRGLRIDDNRRRIQIARKNLSLTDAQFRQQTIDVITNVIQAYWNLTFALRNLQVQIDAVKQARQQVESNRRQVEEGILAPIDIVAAQTQVTNFEQNVYTAQEQVTRAESSLKTLLLPNENAPLWSRAIVPTTPVTIEPPRADFNQALNTALTTRPELEQLRTNQEINQINSRFFRDQTRPQVDLIASFTSAGLAGSTIDDAGRNNPLTSSFGPLFERVNVLSQTAGLPPLELANTNTNQIPANLIGGYGQSLANLAGFNYPSFRVGLRVDLPLFNRTAEANLGRSLAEGSRLGVQRAQLLQQIRQEVQTALQTLRSAEARLASAAASRTSAEQLYGSEQRRFENGTSTVFLVLQRQQELVAARGRELQAQTDLNNAIATFERATGNTFQAHNVEVRGEVSSREVRITTPAGADTEGRSSSFAEPRAITENAP